MLFRSALCDSIPGFLPVNGVYFHGLASTVLAYDCVEISREYAGTFRTRANSPEGIEGMPVEVEGYPGNTVLYAWRYEQADSPWDGRFESTWFRGMIVDASAADDVEYARRCFAERCQML